MAKNKRQPYAVSEKAGEQTSAESWGTGMRRTPYGRVYHTNEQLRPSCRTYSSSLRWWYTQSWSSSLWQSMPIWSHVRSYKGLAQMAPEDQPQPEVRTLSSVLEVVTDTSRRFATASAIAASSVPALLLARGHRISAVPEVPLVVSSTVFEAAALVKTKLAAELLKAVGAGPDIVKVQKSRKLRAGKGKLRGRRHRQRRGPLVVYNPEGDGKELIRAFRNIPGVETSSVHALNLLQLAPGGHLGRFIIWTSSAFAALDEIYGSTTEASALKKDFLLPQNVVANADITRLINSSEIQSVLREPKGYATTKRSNVQKKNPLRNRQVLLRLNPYAAQYSKDKLGQTSVEKDEKPEPVAEIFKETLYTN